MFFGLKTFVDLKIIKIQGQSILDIEVSRKRLLIRADLNVPVNDGKITDDTRIKRFCQGMLKLLQKGAKLIIVTHLANVNYLKNDPLLFLYICSYHSHHREN